MTSAWEKSEELTKAAMREERIQEKVDGDGNRWRKGYFGGGAHFRNWLNQFLELCGEDNIEVEEVDSRGFQCYEQSGEKMYRIWVKEGGREQNEHRQDKRD